MKKTLISLLLLISGQAFGSSLTATITNSDSQTWNNGNWTMRVYSPNGPPTVNGTPLTQAQSYLTGTLSGSGVLTATVTDTSTIAPSGALWTFTICPNATSGCFVANLGVTGASPNLSTALSALAQGPRFPAGPTAYGYLDAEISPTPLPGGSYYNVTTPIGRVWTGSAWTNSGGGSGGDAITSPNSTLSVGGTSAATTLDFNLAHSNTWTAAQTFTTVTTGTTFGAPALILGAASGNGFGTDGGDTVNVFSGGSNIALMRQEYIGLTSGIPICWSTATVHTNGCDAAIGIAPVANGALGVNNGTAGGFSATLQAGVTSTDPGCTTTAHVGKQWFDITTTTTVYKVCLDVAGTLTWVTK